MIVLALTAALVGPYFVDWTSYRADFEREASAVLGRRVTVEGSAKARLLPFPSVSFSDVSVAGARPGEPAMTIESFSMDAELAPFLRGEFLIFDMRLVRPRGTISVDADGTVDWAVRPSTPIDPGKITLEKLTVTDGQITIRHASSGREHLLSDIDAGISARSLAGPWRIDSTLLVDGVRTAIAASTGTLDENGAMRVRIKADPEAYPVAIEADGDVRIENGAAIYAGTFRIGAGAEQAPDPQGGKVAGGEPVKTGPAPYRLNGRFSLDHKRLGVDEFRFETGPSEDPYTADGTAFVDLGAEPRFSIEAKGAQVRFDEAVGTGEQTAGIALKERIAALEKALVSLPKPAMQGTINVDLPAVVAGDTTIRDVRLSAEPAFDGWDVKSLAATLPGRTTLEGNGMLTTDGELGFSGSLLLAVGQPSGFAAWVSKDVDEAIRRLPAAGLSARVDLTTGRQRFRDLELILGPAKFRGEIDNQQPDDTRSSMRLKLEGGALDVDGLTAFASLFVSDKGASRLGDHDLDFDIKAGPVSVAGLTAETVDTALRLRDGTLEIDRLAIGGLANATVSATGRLTGFPENPSGNLDASIIAVDLAPLISTLAERYPDNMIARELGKRSAAYPGLFGDTRIDMVGSAAANGDGTNGIAISANGTSGGSEFSLTGSGNGKLDALDAAALLLSLEARNDNAEALMALYGLPALPLGVAGSGDTTLTAKGTLAGGLDTAVGFTAADMHAEFNGNLGVKDDAVTAKGNIRLEAADIEPWLMTAGVSLPGMGLGLPLELTATADYGKGVLALSSLDGTIDENAVSGDLKAELKDAVPHVTGALSVDALDLRPVAAMVLGEAALQGVDGAWAETAFQPGVAAPFTAELDLSAGLVSAETLGTASDVRMKANLGPEGLRLAEVNGKAYDGDLSGLFELKNTDGTGLFSGQFKLVGADLSLALGETGLAGHGDITASLSASGKSVDAMVASASGSGTAALHGLTVSGVDPSAFPAIVAEADAIGRDIDAARIATFAPALAGAGTFAARDTEVAFTVAGGIVRSPPLVLEDEGATLTAEVRADFNTATVAANGTVAYAPGDEALVGSEPSLRFTIEGPLDGTVRHLDSEPLAQFLTQRALEREQARVEAMQAVLLEKQRLRREVRYYAALQTERRQAAEEAARLKAEEEARRVRAEAEARAKAEEQARISAEEEAKARAEQEARRQAEERARQTAIIESALAKAAEEAKARAEAEARAKAEEEARAKAGEEARRQAEEAQRQAEEAARQTAIIEAALARAAEEAKRKAEEEAQQRLAEQERAGKPQPQVERAPLPPTDSRDGPNPAANSETRRPLEPFSIDNLLKTLQ